MENPVNILIQNVYDCFINSNSIVKNKNRNSLIRVHKEKLHEIGDVSFPINENVWHNYFSNINQDLLTNLGQEKTTAVTKNMILEKASLWQNPVNELIIKNERCALFLNRSILIESLLKQVLSSSVDVSNNNSFGSFGMLKKNTLAKLHLRDLPDNTRTATDLSHYRANLIHNTLRNVLSYSQWQLVDAKDVDGETLEIQVASVVGECNKIEGSLSGSVIKCGLVCDPKTGKLAAITKEEYLSLRSSDMRLMAMHKYGIRVKYDERFCAFMDRLGAAAVTVDLLEVKHSSPVQFIRNSQGSTKGASFILYNSARIETLLRTFEERVQQSSYEQLPALDEINFSLLHEEEEWQLLYGYIFQFPNLIERVVEQIEHGSCATHLIIRFLSEFVGVFSVYYRRIRILTEVREHLMPYVYARICLIKATRIILNKTLSLLNIEPLEFM